MAVNNIFVKIADDTVGDSDVEEYAAFVRQELAKEYPQTTVVVETTTVAVGWMPRVIEADTWEEERRADEFIPTLWERYCTRPVETVHLTEIIQGEVYGHPITECATNCCTVWPAWRYPHVSGDDIRLGSVYELDGDGCIVEEVLD